MPQEVFDETCLFVFKSSNDLHLEVCEYVYNYLYNISVGVWGLSFSNQDKT